MTISTPAQMMIENAIAYVWDHATHEMAGVYAGLAGMPFRIGVVGRFWDELSEEERFALRPVITDMMRAHTHNRFNDQKKKEQAA